MPVSQLERRLNLVDTTLLVIGGIIGTGVFFNTSNVAQRVHTPGLVLAVWLAGGFIAAIGALSYAELGAMMPLVGGPYAFLREGWHPIAGFLYGWTLLLVISPGGTAAVTMKFAQTLGTLVPALGSPWAVRLTGLAAVWLLTLVNYFGVKPGAIVQNIFTSGKLIALAILIVCGFALKHSPGAPSAPGPPWEGSFLTAFGAALAPVLFSYGGWQSVTWTAGEVQNPERNLPRGLLAGTLVVIAVYVSASAVYLHVLPIDAIRQTNTLATDTAVSLLGSAGATFISIAIVVSTFGFIDMTLLTAPRVFYAMGRDGFLFRAAAYVHPKHQTPVTMLIFFAAWTSIVLLAGSYDALLSYTTFGDWIFFGLVVAALFRLRRKQPDAPRPYRVWGYPWLPAIFVAASFGFVIINFVANQPQTSYGLAIIASGIPAFYVFRRFHA
ncbi:MAG: amino acid permease [Acidobacteriaceae bacterium]|nr:amino acid permease [Acidobacteriaceae bacterium]